MADYLGATPATRRAPKEIVVRLIEQSSLKPGMTLSRLFATPALIFRGLLEIDGIYYKLSIDAITPQGGGLQSVFQLARLNDSERLLICESSGERRITYIPRESALPAEAPDFPASALALRDTVVQAILPPQRQNRLRALWDHYWSS
ncbi:MAG: hypothetical protein IPK79_11090 [Vampirovibrionales bacterium]|nr:hypothetical protein [Vampirovibrionales bacterium]